MPYKEQSESFRYINGSFYSQWMDARSDLAKAEAARIRKLGFSARCVSIGDGEHRVFVEERFATKIPGHPDLCSSQGERDE
jgi:hypothetical protein